MYGIDQYVLGRSLLHVVFFIQIYRFSVRSLNFSFGERLKPAFALTWVWSSVLLFLLILFQSFILSLWLNLNKSKLFNRHKFVLYMRLEPVYRARIVSLIFFILDRQNKFTARKKVDFPFPQIKYA